MSGNSLTELMNNMIARLETIEPDMLHQIPEERYWHMISLYIKIDPVLAQLFKQYCAAKDHLGQLLSSSNANDPMAEIAWDMHDSLRSAIDTRLLELKDSDEATEKLMALKNNHNILNEEKQKIKKRTAQRESMENLMAFMVWTGLVMKDVQPVWNLKTDFCQAS